VTTAAASRGARGAAVTVSGQFVKLLIQMIALVALSRLLTPGDFGLIAMVMVFVGLGELIRDFGLPTAALQAKTLSDAQASNFFWANAALGALSSVLLLAATPIVVAIYDEPRLAGVMPALAIAPLLNGLQAQLQVRLARKLRFTAISATEVLAQSVGLGAAIWAAAAGAGYWALVVQSLAIAAVLLLSRAALAQWVPGVPRRGVGSRVQLASGGNLGMAMLLSYAATNADSLVMGARFGAEVTGYYSRAFQLLSVPINGLLSPLTQVVVPIVNEMRKSGSRAVDTLLRVQNVLGTLAVWVFAVAAASASDWIPLVLGAQWAGSISYFQILAIGGSVQVFSFVSYWAFIVEEQSRELLRYNLLTKPLAIALIVAGSFAGPAGVAWAYTLGLIVSWPINLVWLARTAGYPALGFLMGGLRTLAAASAGYVAGVGLTHWLGLENSWGSVAIVGGVVTVVYTAAIVVLPGGWRSLKSDVFMTIKMLRAGSAR